MPGYSIRLAREAVELYIKALAAKGVVIQGKAISGWNRLE